MTIHITEEDAKRLLREAVQEKGADYVYPREIIEESGGCRYAYNGKPSCIVGHVLVSAGVPVEDLRKIEGTLFHAGVAQDLGVEVDGRAAYILSEAQAAQDYGRPWGDALDAAGVELL